jgi:hypothetical protein
MLYFFEKNWHYFDIFLSPHFSFFLCDKYSVVISKVHYESISFLEFIQKNYDDSHYNMNHYKIDNANFEYDFRFYIYM